LAPAFTSIESMIRILCLFSVMVLADSCHRRPVALQALNSLGEKIYQSADAPRTSALLPDSSTAWMNTNTTIRVKSGFGESNRDLFLDGEALFIIHSKSPYPFIVHTRALIVEVNSPSALFKMDSYRHHAGEELDVLNGKLTARKSYRSGSDSAVESLRDGEMVMINTDIDLMEKEKSDSLDWRSWINSNEREAK
jgi:ferric-dicitrate binding protein FerR (iron transport regulator)